MSALDSPLVVGAVTTILGLFGGGTIVSLFKLPGERNQVVIAAAQGAVVIQSGLLVELRNELDRALEKIDALEGENIQLRARVRDLELRA